MDSDDDDFLMASMPLDDVKYEPSTQSQKKTSWVSSAFDDFNVESKLPTSSKYKSGDIDQFCKKRKTTSCNENVTASATTNKHKKSSQSESTDLWSDRYAPSTLSELAVHKKKVQEVQGWLDMCFNRRNHTCPILLLTGPCGTGKTATMSVLAKEMGYELMEWINPVQSAYEALQSESSGYGYMQHQQYPISQSREFSDFLLRANKYQALQIFSTDKLQRKAILVEDFPNIFFRDPAKFHEIVRQYRRQGKAPLVFIVSDTATGGTLERKLFPKELQEEMQIANISFNPVAQTSLVKVLGRIAAAEASKSGCPVPEKSMLENLATSCSGDLRGAINALQFSSQTCKRRDTKSLKPSAKVTSKRSNKKATKKPDTEAAAVGERDTTLFLFRALGKILYCKRGEPQDFPNHPPISEQQPKELYRDPLLFNPEEVLEKCHLTGDCFTAYLHQNYMDFYSQLDDVVAASAHISDADNLTKEWQSRSVLLDYSSSVAARAIVFCNSDRAYSSTKGSGLGWKPLHKPQWMNANKEITSNCQAIKELFKGQCSTPIELQTQLIPYAALIGMTSLRQGQQHYINTVGRISKQRRAFVERLDEKDVATQQLLENEDEEGEDITTPEMTLTSQANEDNTLEEVGLNDEDDELNIEEFDD